MESFSLFYRVVVPVHCDFPTPFLRRIDLYADAKDKVLSPPRLTTLCRHCVREVSSLTIGAMRPTPMFSAFISLAGIEVETVSTNECVRRRRTYA